MRGLTDCEAIHAVNSNYHMNGICIRPVWHDIMDSNSYSRRSATNLTFWSPTGRLSIIHVHGLIRAPSLFISISILKYIVAYQAHPALVKTSLMSASILKVVCQYVYDGPKGHWSMSRCGQDDSLDTLPHRHKTIYLPEFNANHCILKYGMQSHPLKMNYVE